MTSIVAGDETNNMQVAKVLVTGADGNKYEAQAVVPVGADGAIGSNPDGVSDAATTAPWTGGSVSTAGYSSAFVEVTTYSTAITIKGGVSAANALQVINLADGTTSATITATGLYAVPAVGNLTATGIGSGVVNLMLKR